MSLSARERQAFLLTLYQRYLRGELSQGLLLRTLRKRVLGFNQTRYAELVGISRRTLSDIERDSGSPAQTAVAKAFGPFGLKPGVVLVQSKLIDSLLEGRGPQQ